MRSNVKVESEPASVVFSENKVADEVEFSTDEPSGLGFSVNTSKSGAEVVMLVRDADSR